MSAPHPVQALALQLADALLKYQTDMDQLYDSAMAPELYHSVGNRLDEIRALKTSMFPQFSSELVEVLITHSELTHALWSREMERLRGVPDGSEQAALAELRTRHRDAVTAMGQGCLRVGASATPRRQL